MAAILSRPQCVELKTKQAQFFYLPSSTFAFTSSACSFNLSLVCLEARARSVRPLDWKYNVKYGNIFATIFFTHMQISSIHFAILLMLDTDCYGFGGQYHACWCPGSWSRQRININDIGCVGQTTCIAVPEFNLHRSSQFQDMIQNVNISFVIFKIIQHVKSYYLPRKLYFKPCQLPGWF